MYLFCHFFKNFQNFGNRCISFAIFAKLMEKGGGRCGAIITDSGGPEDYVSELAGLGWY